MNFPKTTNVRIVFPNAALRTVFDECDQYTAEETGGRILGTYKENSNVLTIHVNGIIEPGPSTARTASYLKQDGAYQERIFRQVEEREPSVEHLGNWHSHHVNGLPHLSDGDIATYRRTVEHHKHNTNFFYALLVTKSNSTDNDLGRYSFKNYILRRGNLTVYEIPPSALTFTDTPLIWPLTSGTREKKTSRVARDDDAFRKNRIFDREMVSQFYPRIRTFRSKSLGICWRGGISLVNGSEQEVVVIEDDSGTDPRYTAVLTSAPGDLTRSAQALSEIDFASCREALISTERTCNAELYERKPTASKGRRKWTF